MSVSMTPINSAVINTEEIKNMNFLGLQISNIFNKSTDKTMQITGLAKELLGSKKETPQETEVALLSSRYSSFIEKQPLKLLAMSLHRLSGTPLEVGLEYIEKAPGYDSKKGFQVPNDWERNGTVTLPQIYKEQFFAWILKNNKLPFSSILNMLHILKSFDDPSIPLDNKIWDKFLLTEKRQKQFKEFQSKYEFLVNNKFFQSFPVELEKITITRNIQKSIHHQYELFEKVLSWMLQSLESVQSEEVLENFLLKDENAWKGFSSKVLMYKLKKMLPFLQEKLTHLINHLNQNERDEQKKEADQAQLTELEDTHVEINKVLDICKAKRECISNQTTQSTSKDKKKKGKNQPANVKFDIEQIQRDLMGQYFESEKAGISKEERDAQFNQDLHRILNEKMTTIIHVQQAEAVFNKHLDEVKKQKSIIKGKLLCDRLNLQKKDFSLSCFLINHMNHCLTKEQIQSKEKIKGLSLEQFDEMLERQFEPERRISASKSYKAQINVSEVVEEESVQIVESESAEKVQSPSEAQSIYKDLIQIYLENKEKDKQLNGCFSQKIENYLEQIKPLLNQEQGKEVYFHTLLGTAALEHMAQAVYEGRKDHVVLGFRSLLIHCYFSVEQMLSQKIFENTGVIANSHDLSYLANQLEGDIVFSKEEKKFFKDKIQLWFRYPEDYRLRFNEENERRLQRVKKINPLPKALSLLDALSKSEISVDSLQEAMEFSFEKYCQALELVVKLTKAPVTVDLKNNISDLQKQLSNSLKFKKKSFLKPTPLLNEVEKAKAILGKLEKLDQVQDLEKGELLASLNTIKSYLQYMEISLQTPQESAVHSLQKFLQAETLLNMDKLFKHLFRAISILHLEVDNQAHNLRKFYAMIDGFYGGSLLKESKKLLEDINLHITHHYFHRESNAGLQENYNRLLRNALILSSVPKGFTAFVMNKEISDKTLQEDGEIITHAILSSFQLFNQLLPRVISDIEAINDDIEKELNRLQIG